jgi:hypothetical protein
VENFTNPPVLTALDAIPSCEKSVSISAVTHEEDFRFCQFPSYLHSFHISFTTSTKEDCVPRCKSSNSCHLTAQLLGQFIQQPVQIFVVLANLFDFLYRVQHGRVMLSSELPSNLG